MKLLNKYAYKINDNATYCLSLSYGKDSIACLGAIKKLGLPLHRVIHAEIWATQELSADLPEMVDFKAKVDKWILENFGIEVEHFCATKPSTWGVGETVMKIVFTSLLIEKTDGQKE